MTPPLPLPTKAPRFWPSRLSPARRVLVCTRRVHAVLPGTPCVKGAPQAEETTCAREAARVCEPPCVGETPRVSAPVGVNSVVCMYEARESERPCVGRKTVCVRSLYTREMTVAMHDHAAASPGVGMRVNVVVCRMGLATRGSLSARAAWRLRLRLWRDKCRVAAVVVIGTVPGLHGRSVLCHGRDHRVHGCEGKRPGPETHAVMLLVPRTDKGQAG